MTTVWNGAPPAASPGRLGLGERIAQALGIRGKVPALRLAPELSLVLDVAELGAPFALYSAFSGARAFTALGAGVTSALYLTNEATDPFQAVVLDRVLFSGAVASTFAIRTGASQTGGFIASDADARMNAPGTDTLAAEVRGGETFISAGLAATQFPRLQWLASVPANAEPLEARGPWTIRPGTALAMFSVTENTAFNVAFYGRTYRES